MDVCRGCISSSMVWFDSWASRELNFPIWTVHIAVHKSLGSSGKPKNMEPCDSRLAASQGPVSSSSFGVVSVASGSVSSTLTSLANFRILRTSGAQLAMSWSSECLFLGPKQCTALPQSLCCDRGAFDWGAFDFRSYMEAPWESLASSHGRKYLIYQHGTRKVRRKAWRNAGFEPF